MSGFRVVLDSCVLVPIVKADLLLTLAQRHAFHPLWTDRILDEIGRAIVKVNPTVDRERARRRTDLMNAAFEDAMVVDWEPLEGCVVGLRDVNDRHVVAAAVRGNAAAIVTDNITDFPRDALSPWGLHAVTSDDFLLDVLDLNPHRGIACLIEMSERRRRPPLTVSDLLDRLEQAGAPRFAREARSILDE